MDAKAHLGERRRIEYSQVVTKNNMARVGLGEALLFWRLGGQPSDVCVVPGRVHEMEAPKTLKLKFGDAKVQPITRHAIQPFILARDRTSKIYTLTSTVSVAYEDP